MKKKILKNDDNEKRKGKPKCSLYDTWLNVDNTKSYLYENKKVNNEVRSIFGAINEVIKLDRY